MRKESGWKNERYTVYDGTELRKKYETIMLDLSNLLRCGHHVNCLIRR